MVSQDIDALRIVASANIGGSHGHMSKIQEIQRNRDIREWIEDNVNLTVYDHDPLSPGEAAAVLDSVKKELIADPVIDPIVSLKIKLWDHLWEAYQDWESDVTHDAAKNLAKTFNMDEEDALEYIHNNTGISFPLDDYLSDSYDTVIMLDTGDSNYDFSLNQVEPAHGGDPIEDISDKSSLVWLAEQNGYPKEEFIRLMQHIKEIPKDEHPFIHSVYENLENTSSSTNGVAFLGKMSLADLAKAQKEGVTVPKRTSCGLYDGWNGAGSPFDIKLQKDIVIPKDVIWSVLPDCNYTMQYTVDETYLFANKVWQTHFFAGEAKEFDPEQIEQAKALCEKPPRISALEGTVSAWMQEKFANAFRNYLVQFGGGIYDGMLDRGQFAIAAKRAIDRVCYETTGLGKKEYQFSETYFRELLQEAPCKLSQEFIDSHMKRFDILKGR